MLVLVSNQEQAQQKMITSSPAIDPSSVKSSRTIPPIDSIKHLSPTSVTPLKMLDPVQLPDHYDLKTLLLLLPLG